MAILTIWEHIRRYTTVLGRTLSEFAGAELTTVVAVWASLV